MKLLPLLFLATSLSGQTVTNTVTLGWNYGDPYTIVGFRLYVGPSSGTYTQVFEVDMFYTNATVSVVGKVGHHAYFACTAIDSSGVESQPSNEAVWTFVAPTNSGQRTATFNWTANRVCVETATDLRGPWVMFGYFIGLHGMTVPATDEGRFFKIEERP